MNTYKRNARGQYVKGYPHIDMTGLVFGRLTVASFVGIKNEKSIWHCICTCGGTKDVRRVYLLSGETQSCGCLHSERTSQAHKKHGMHGTSVYRRWRSMLSRCVNPRSTAYTRYGGRGITVCERWQKSFAAFYTDMGDPPRRMTLERRNNDGPYSPENCLWATPKRQANNTRRNRWIVWRDARHTLSEWSIITGLSVSTISRRLRAGWSVDHALGTIVR